MTLEYHNIMLVLYYVITISKVYNITISGGSSMRQEAAKHNLRFAKVKENRCQVRGS